MSDRTVPAVPAVPAVAAGAVAPTAPRLPLGDALSVVAMGLPVVGLVELGVVVVAGTPVLLRVSGCLLVPGVPGAPGVVDWA